MISSVHPHSLLEKIPDAILLVGQNELIAYANQTAKNIFANRKLEQLTLSELFPDSRFIKLLHEVNKSQKEVSEKLIFPQQASPLGNQENRGVNAWQIHLIPLTVESGYTMQCLLKDITAEYQSEQIRKDFVANASHELRTPLAIIKGYLENLLEADGLENTKDAQWYLHIMEKHTERISHIVDDMLLISRLESDDAPELKQEIFSIKNCVEDVMVRLEHLVQSNQADVQLEISPENVSLKADRFYITQVLFNLIENALKQNPHKALTIKIKAKQVEQKAIISIMDNGIGIPTEHLAFIFKRFYRVDQAHSNHQIKGTGLGLSIVKRAIEAHGGSISVTSTPGLETKFTIELPI